MFSTIIIRPCKFYVNLWCKIFFFLPILLCSFYEIWCFDNYKRVYLTGRYSPSSISLFLLWFFNWWFLSFFLFLQSADYKYFTSPNFPNNYDSNLDCSWTLSVKSGAIIQLRFHTFNLEQGYDTDYVNVYDGDTEGVSSGRLLNTRGQESYKVNFHCLCQSDYAHIYKNNWYTW